MKYRERVLGLILVSPLCKAPSWTEWVYNKVPYLQNSIDIMVAIIMDLTMNITCVLQVMSNLLYFYGMCGLLKEFLLQRYFSKVNWNIFFSPYLFTFYSNVFLLTG